MNSSHPAQPDTGMHPLLPQAVSLHQAGKLAEAAQLYETILVQMPRQFDAAHLLGVIALQEGRLHEAQRRIASALEFNPHHAAALSNLAAAYLRDNALESALLYARRACESEPDSLDGLINLGSILRKMGRSADAVAPLRRALDLSQSSTVVTNLLGACLLDGGEASAAAQLFELGTRASPQDGDSWANLAAALSAMSEHARALQCAERAVALRGDSAAALSAQAAAQFELGKVDEAIATYRSAMPLSPSLQTLCSFASALITSGLSDEAITILGRAIEMDGSNPVTRWALTIAQIKPIYEHAADMELSRERFSAKLADLKAWFENNPSAPAHTAVGTTQPFYIAYHPHNNRDLLSRYGQLCADWMKSLPDAAAGPPALSRARSKIRIGIVSAHIREHSVWFAITKGWIQNLDRTRFEVHVFHLNNLTDAETKYCRQKADYFEDRLSNLPEWIAAIRQAQLDVLIYPELGMDMLTTQLASLRLASLQAAAWGHPETTGLPTIDLYLSAEAFETPDSDKCYREKLVRLPNLGVYVDPLTPKTLDPNLKALGLPKGEALLLCPGTAFKYTPKYDQVWLNIAKGLERARSGRLVFFGNSSGSMSLLLTSRLRRVFAESGVDFDARVCVIPLLDRARFFGLMDKATLMLDTLGFSGFNTALQSIECGLPVLAYEGEFMRGKLTSAIMRRMDLPELVATNQHEFVERALSLVADKGKLKRLRAEIIKRRRILFSDQAPIRTLEQVLEKEITARSLP